jgi:D-serine deaminase-like pyridoxal phosphate-dependent protein
MKHLIGEINSCKQAVQRHSQFFSGRRLVMGRERPHRQCLQRNLLRKDQSGPEMKTLRDLQQCPPLSDLGVKVKIEPHTGVYPLLDMQQLSTNASAQLRSPKDDITVSVLAEVCSVYNDGEIPSPEALVAAGMLVLGREKCPRQYLRGDYPLRTCLRV